jgi:hypothetical protein
MKTRLSLLFAALALTAAAMPGLAVQQATPIGMTGLTAKQCLDYCSRVYCAAEYETCGQYTNELGQTACGCH